MSDELSNSTQENILTLLCFDDESAPIITSNIDSGLFSNTFYRNIARRAINFYKEFSKTPKIHIADLLETELEEGSTRPIYIKILENLFENQNSINKDYALSTLEKFVREQTLKLTITKAAAAIQGGKIEEAESILEQGRRKSATVFDPGTFMFSDETRTFTFLDKLESDDYIHTGIKQLDDLEICPAPGELFTFLARSGAGKSWLLVHLSKFALLQRKKVLHISLELSEERLKARYFQTMFGILNRQTNLPILSPVFEVDSRGVFSNVNFREVEHRPSLQDGGIITVLKEKVEKLFLPQLIIKEFPTGTLSVSKLKTYLDNLEGYYNFIPDIILLDYLDLMEIDSDKLRIDLGQTAIALRGIAGERNVAMVTVAQTNKSAEGKKLLTRKYLAEDFSKVRVSDNLITYTQTNKESKMGMARLFVDKARNSPGNVVILISQNYSIGQFCISSSKLVEDEAYWEIIGGASEE
jgi:replicative DNA helicase